MTSIRASRANGIGRIALATPGRGNAIDRAMADALFEALTALERDPQVRLIAIEADGDDFSTGVDVLLLTAQAEGSPDAAREESEALGRVILALRALMKPVVAVVRGRAVGTGAALATACDVVLAHEAAEFGFPEVRHGAVAALAMPVLRRSVGEKSAAELLLSGRVLSAEEAERVGLVSRVVPAATFEEEVEGALLGIARSSATALALSKWLLYKLDTLSLEDGVAAGVVTTVEARGTDDFRAGVQRLLDEAGG